MGDGLPQRTTVRHGSVPLRLGAAGTDAVVESMPLRCSHFDAFRFFTPEAAPRNAEALSRDTQVATRAAGLRARRTWICTSGAYKLGPLVESELLLDCLSWRPTARELDMRASPYDLQRLRIRADRRRERRRAAPSTCVASRSVAAARRAAAGGAPGAV